MAGWAFYDLQAKIVYRVEARGVRVLKVEPAYTSQAFQSAVISLTPIVGVRVGSAVNPAATSPTRI